MCWEESERVNKVSKIFVGIDVRTVSYLRVYYSLMPKFLRFEIPDEDWFLVFGVPNVKYLAFISYLRVYCSLMPKFLRFEIPDEDWFLVFGVPNVKYLAFGTPDGNAPITINCDVTVYNW